MGESLANLLTRQLAGHEVVTVGFDGEILERHHGGSRALLTQCGSWGDPGTAEGNWIFNLPRASIIKLLSEDTALETVWEGTQPLDGLPWASAVAIRHAVSAHWHGPYVFTSTYLPAGRGEDVLFGIMVQRLHPESAVWNEGWAIRHEREERTERGGLTPLSVKPRLSMLTDWLGREPRGSMGSIAATTTCRLTRSCGDWRKETDSIETLIQQELVSKRGALLDRCMNHLGDAKEMSELPGHFRLAGVS